MNNQASNLRHLDDVFAESCNSLYLCSMGNGKTLVSAPGRMAHQIDGMKVLLLTLMNTWCWSLKGKFYLMDRTTFWRMTPYWVIHRHVHPPTDHVPFICLLDLIFDVFDMAILSQSKEFHDQNRRLLSQGEYHKINDSDNPWLYSQGTAHRSRMKKNEILCSIMIQLAYQPPNSQPIVLYKMYSIP